MKVKLLEPIEGFEDVAEYRSPRKGDFYYQQFARDVRQARMDNEYGYAFCLTPIKRWRPATIDDAVRAIRGELIVARFRNHETSQWKQSELVGFINQGEYKWMAKEPFAGFYNCEVLDA